MPLSLQQWPGFRSLLAALGTLTRLPPATRSSVESPQFAQATVYFPLVGLLIGLLLLGIDYLLASWPTEASALVLVATWAAVAREADRSIDWLLLPAWLVKVIALTVLGRHRQEALLFAPLLGRWAMVVVATGARNAAAPQRKLNPAINFGEFAFTSVAAGIFVSSVGRVVGLLLFVVVAGATLGVRALAHAGERGVSTVLLWRTVQVIEVLSLTLLAGLLVALR